MREDWIEIDYKKVVNKISTNNKKLKQKEYLQKGVFPVIDQGQDLVGGYTDDETKLLNCELPVIVFGDHTKIVKLINFKFAPGADGTKVLEPKKFVLPIYLSYLTQILVFKIKDKGYARHYQHIEKQTFPIAPLPEQRAIVAKIEQLFSELDNGIANLKAAKDKLEIYRQAVLKKAFEGELTKVWRKQNELDGWREVPITELGDIMTGNTPSKKNEDFYSSREYNFYKPTDLEAGNIVSKSIDSLSLQGFESGRQAPEGSVLVTCIGATIGKTGLIKKEGCFNQQINAIIPFEGFDPKFIYYQAIGIDFQTQIKTKASATTLPILNKGKFSKLIMSICSKAEQTQIVQEIESRLSVCDNILANIEEGLEKSEALRQSILKQAFEGKLLNEEELEACRKEPGWESAEALLERIKKEHSLKEQPIKI